jgi:hypothetical protein
MMAAVSLNSLTMIRFCAHMCCDCASSKPQGAAEVEGWNWGRGTQPGSHWRLRPSVLVPSELRVCSQRADGVACVRYCFFPISYCIIIYIESWICIAAATCWAVERWSCRQCGWFDYFCMHTSYRCFERVCRMRDVPCTVHAHSLIWCGAMTHSCRERWFGRDCVIFRFACYCFLVWLSLVVVVVNTIIWRGMMYTAHIVACCSSAGRLRCVFIISVSIQQWGPCSRCFIHWWDILYSIDVSCVHTSHILHIFDKISEETTTRPT